MVDPVKRAVIRRYRLYPATPHRPSVRRQPSPLFSATGNRKLVVLNSDTGEFLAVLRIGWSVDGAAYTIQSCGASNRQRLGQHDNASGKTPRTAIMCAKTRPPASADIRWSSIRSHTPSTSRTSDRSPSTRPFLVNNALAGGSRGKSSLVG